MCVSIVSTGTVAPTWRAWAAAVDRNLRTVSMSGQGEVIGSSLPAGAQRRQRRSMRAAWRRAQQRLERGGHLVVRDLVEVRIVRADRVERRRL